MANQYVDAEGNRRPDAPTGSQNQFTTGKRKAHDQRTKDAIRAELLSKRLYTFVTGTQDTDTGEEVEAEKKIELSPAQVAAAKILIDKGKPNLQAVEQTTKSEWDDMSEDEIKGMLHALISSHPWLIRELQSGPRPVDEPHHGSATG